MLDQMFPERRYQCNMCNRRYTHERSLRSHQKHECGQDRKFKCPECDFNSKLKGNWKHHILVKHPNIGKKMFAKTKKYNIVT